jgi:hypothetical protein
MDLAMEPSMSIAYHVTLRLDDGRVLCRDAAMRRRAMRRAYEQGEPRGLISVRFADTHAHAVLAAQRPIAGAFAAVLERSLRWRLELPVSFEPARFRPISDQRHLGHAHVYLMRQELRHGTGADPFQDGSSLLELIGARVLLDLRSAALDPRSLEPRILGATSARRAITYLPRVRVRDLMEELGLILAPPEALEVLREEDAFGLLRDAAEAALGLDDLDGRGADRTIARRAAAQLGSRVLSTGQLADRLHISARAVQQVLLQPTRDDVRRAIALQVRLRLGARIAASTFAGSVHDAAEVVACSSAGSVGDSGHPLLDRKPPAVSSPPLHPPPEAGGRVGLGAAKLSDRLAAITGRSFAAPAGVRPACES